jgi:hypothetical protein
LSCGSCRDGALGVTSARVRTHRRPLRATGTHSIPARPSCGRPGEARPSPTRPPCELRTLCRSRAPPCVPRPPRGPRCVPEPTGARAARTQWGVGDVCLRTACWVGRHGSRSHGSCTRRRRGAAGGGRGLAERPMTAHSAAQALWGPPGAVAPEASAVEVSPSQPGPRGASLEPRSRHATQALEGYACALAVCAHGGGGARYMVQA